MWAPCCCVQARGKFGLRTRALRLHEPTFIPEAEQQLLSSALTAWQRKAEAGVAAAALEVGVARWRLLHHASRRAFTGPACLLASQKAPASLHCRESRVPVGTPCPAPHAMT
jgi:hypothetical protein